MHFKKAQTRTMEKGCARPNWESLVFRLWTKCVVRSPVLEVIDQLMLQRLVTIEGCCIDGSPCLPDIDVRDWFSLTKAVLLGKDCLA